MFKSIVLALMIQEYWKQKLVILWGLRKSQKNIKVSKIGYLLWYWTDCIGNCSYYLKRLFKEVQGKSKFPKQTGLSWNYLYLTRTIWNSTAYEALWDTNSDKNNCLKRLIVLIKTSSSSTGQKQFILSLILNERGHFTPDDHINMK